MNNVTAFEQAINQFFSAQLAKGYELQSKHPYRNSDGTVIYWRPRLKNGSGDKFIRPMYKDKQGIFYLGEPPELKDTQKPLYGLDLLAKYSEATVVIVEGEYPADVLNAFFDSHHVNEQFIAMTSGSATSADKADLTPLENHKVLLWPDNDDAGVKHMQKIYELLLQFNCSVEMLDIAQLNLQQSDDCVDWLNANPGCNPDKFIGIPVINVLPPAPEDVIVKCSQSTELVQFILQYFDLFHDKNKDVYAKDLMTNEVWQILTRQFKDLITAKYYKYTSTALREQSYREALITISGIGRHSKPCYVVNCRVAKFEESLFIDLCQPGKSKAVKLFAGGWEIVDSPPVTFIRSNTMQELPMPIRGGDLSLLWNVCNIPTDSELLVLAWLAETLRPDTPYPVLEIVGEQGSAKSTTQTILRRIIDPNACDLRAAPKHVEDLYIAAGTNHFVSYENISHLTASMQDALCILATGGGHAKRRLYTDKDEDVVHAFNPVIINGISPVITAQDLIDRTITIELPNLTNRSSITDIKMQLEIQHSGILGGLLDLIAKALVKLPEVTLPQDKRPRLYEFAQLGIAIAEAQNIPCNVFMEQFTASRQESIARTIDASPVASALIEWFDSSGRNTKKLSAKDLFSSIEIYKPKNTDAWPRTAKGFSDALRRVIPALRQIGIECKCHGKQGSYVYWEVFSR